MKPMTVDQKCNPSKLTLIDIWQTYPYKKLDLEKSFYSQTGKTYVAKSDLNEDHFFSISYHDYKMIHQTFFKKALEYIQEGREVYIPHLGKFSYRKYKKNPREGFKKLIDYKATREVYGKWNEEHPDDKKYVYHDNRHTDGYILHSYWDNNKLPIRNSVMAHFKYTRKNNREMAKILNETPHIIYNFENFNK